jgi:ELWxxDGT repeat protein
MLPAWYRHLFRSCAATGSRRLPTAAPQVEVLEDRTVPSATLVKDINQLPVNAYPSHLTDVNGTLYFTTIAGPIEKDLWKTDGTAAGTSLLKAFFPSGGEDPSNLTNVNGKLFFRVDADPHTLGPELWVSDGTAAGTHLVVDLNPGSPGSNPRDLTNVNGTLYFLAGGPGGNGLWKTDGTAAGTVFVAAAGDNLTNVNGSLYFTLAGDLWKSDGTTAGTALVRTVEPGYHAGGTWAYDLTNVKGTLYFLDGNDHYRLWKSDGTAAGTVALSGPNFIVPGDALGNSGLTAVGNTVFFVGLDSAHGYELWKSNGTAAGTVMVKDIIVGTGGIDLQSATAVGNTLFFVINDGVHGDELWRSDGSAAGTNLVKDIAPGFGVGSNPTALVNDNGTLYFTANDGVHGAELWRSDGTAAGTRLVSDIEPGSSGSNPQFLTVSGNRLFFAANTKTSGNELWVSDGTATGTVLVKGIGGGNQSSWPSELTDVNGTLFFGADDGIHGAELWKSDGTMSGTRLVKDILPGTASSIPLDLTDVNGVLFFAAYDSTGFSNLWRSDGTAAGTQQVLIGPPGGPGADANDLTNVNGTLYFLGFFGDREFWGLWKSDGTAAGTTFVAPAHNGYNLTKVGNELFFTASDGAHSQELWKSDGTAAGTVLVKDIYPGPATPTAWNAQITAVGSTLYFTATDGLSEQELWKSDGTAAGTVLVRNFGPGGSGLHLARLTNFNGKLFFQADGLLYTSDGTFAGTRPVFANDGSLVHNPVDLTVANNLFFFGGTDQAHGDELWRSDGTSAGTRLVKDIDPGLFGSGPTQLTAVGKALFFVAWDPVNGAALWQSDGTQGGTNLVDAINPASRFIPLWNLTAVGGTLFFSASDGFTGYELWKAGAPAPHLSLAAPLDTKGDTPFPVTVFAPSASYTGTIHFSSSDSAATLPADYTFVAADRGSHVFNIALQMPGSATLTVTDTTQPALSASAAVNVAPAVTHFRIDAPAGVTAGMVFGITVTALDANNRAVAGYVGTIHFTNTRGLASLPADYTFVPGDQGRHTFLVTLRSAGSQTLTIKDKSSPGLTGSATVTVSAAAAAYFSISAPSVVLAYQPFTVTVRARDAYGNAVTNYQGTVHFTSHSAPVNMPGDLPADFAFTPANQGVHTFSGKVWFPLVRGETLTVTDTLSTSLTGSIYIALMPPRPIDPGPPLPMSRQT